MNLSKMTADEIRNELVSNGYMTLEEANAIKGKSNLKVMYESLVSGEVQSEIENITDELNEEMPTETYVDDQVVVEEGPQIPSYASEEWQDYVLSQFTDDELVEGKYPTLPGLRRLTEALLGEIIDSGPVNVQYEHDGKHDAGRATVTYNITIAWKVDLAPYIDIDKDLPYRKFRAIGGAGPHNIQPEDSPFVNFPEAIAENRAEVRALRKALRLTACGIEELPDRGFKGSKKTVDEEFEQGTKINDFQKKSLKILCERLNIDIDKFIDDFNSKKYKSIDEIERMVAGKMLRRLDEYQKDTESIPESILKESVNEG